ncbi:MAG: sigma-70 family RNA polymerase sigma factor [Planctomycetes bacterium]|nr:sigma-70 family RNA polymerase sigma factor [Planctomycetota bacterium]
MGSPLSREEVFDRHFDDVYVYVAYLVAPDREAARDITQDVFLAAMAALETFRGDSSVLSWLRSIARNRVASHFRSAATQRRESTLSTEALAEIATAEPDVAASEKEERVVRISQVIRSLPQTYCELLEQKYLDGATVRTMAKQRKQSEEAIESALARARGAFRTVWRQKYGQDLQGRPDTERSSLHEGP